MRLGYVRVLAKDQNTDAQIAALKSANCDSLVKEKASTSQWERPQLQKLLAKLCPNDVLVVWKLDCLSHSLQDLLFILEKIDHSGAHFQSVTEGIETTSTARRKMMHLMSSLAAFERSLLKKRTRTGLEEARKVGRIGGRPSKLTTAQQQEIVALVTSGKKSGAQAARLFQVHPATVSRVVALHRAAAVCKADHVEHLKQEKSAKKKKPVAKKTISRKRSSKKTKSAAPVKTTLDAIGLSRSEHFADFPAAVSVLAEAKTLRIMDHYQWQASTPRTFMAIWEAEKHIDKFRQKHADASIEQSYKVKDKTIMELMAVYDDDRADHRVVYQARNR